MQCNNPAPSLKHRPNAMFLVLMMSLEHSSTRCGYWQVPKRTVGSIARHNFAGIDFQSFTNLELSFSLQRW